MRQLSNSGQRSAFLYSQAVNLVRKKKRQLSYHETQDETLFFISPSLPSFGYRPIFGATAG